MYSKIQVARATTKPWKVGGFGDMLKQAAEAQARDNKQVTGQAARIVMAVGRQIQNNGRR